jgi:RNA polymerase sigma factor (TIGR02999 family)
MLVSFRPECFNARIGPSLDKAEIRSNSPHLFFELFGAGLTESGVANYGPKQLWTVEDLASLLFTWRALPFANPCSRALTRSRTLSPVSSEHVSKLLANWGRGDQDARDALIPLVYGELRRVARRYLRRERPDHTLQSAALVHEAYLRLVNQEAPEWQSRAHFFGVAAQLMRHILVDHARKRRAAKRGAGAPLLTLDPQVALPQKQEVDLVALDEALNTLASIDPQRSRIVELRFFAGLSIEETALVLGISAATVSRDWATSRAWLQREMKKKEVRK